MPKEPISFERTHSGEFGLREQDGFEVPNKYKINPRKNKNIALENLTRVINSEQNSCIICVERSIGTCLQKMPGDLGRALLDKCVKLEWQYQSIIPGSCFKFYNINAEPGSPLEIKFYFYDNFFRDKHSKIKFFSEKHDPEKERLTDIKQIEESLKAFFVFEEVLVDPQITQKIMNNKLAFIQFVNKDYKTIIKGIFIDTPSPEEKVKNS